MATRFATRLLFLPRSHAYSLSISSQPPRICDRIKTQGKSHATSLPPIIQSARKCGLLSRPSQNLLLGTSLHPLLRHTGDCWLRTCNSRMCCMEQVMCCQSLGHCFWKCEKSSSSWSSRVWYLRSVRVLRWRVGSWQRLANSLLLQLSFTFSRTGGLVPAWWASECLARKLTSHHTSGWILLVYLSGACSDAQT
jgi:hypothetical protein